jgi:hypothetical protein
LLIKSIWNKEELPDQWKESIIVPVHKKGDKTDCSNYRGISLLSTSNKILSNILLSRLSPYIDEIIGDHQLFVDFKKAYDSVRREVLYNILIEFWIPMKLGGLIKISFHFI